MLLGFLTFQFEYLCWENDITNWRNVLYFYYGTKMTDKEYQTWKNPQIHSIAIFFG